MFKTVRVLNDGTFSSAVMRDIAVQYHIGRRSSAPFGPLMIFDSEGLARGFAAGITRTTGNKTAVLQCEYDPYPKRVNSILPEMGIGEAERFWSGLVVSATSIPPMPGTVFAATITPKELIYLSGRVYKVAIKWGRRYESITQVRHNPYSVSYVLGRITEPRVGKLMAFNTLKRAAKTKIFWRAHWPSKDFRILECNAEIAIKQRDDVLWVSAVSSAKKIEEHWSSDKEGGTSVPPGTVMCDSISPIREIG